MTIVSQYLFSPFVVIEAPNLAGHMSFQNKDYIFQPPLQPHMVT